MDRKGRERKTKNELARQRGMYRKRRKRSYAGERREKEREDVKAKSRRNEERIERRKKD
jgi:hypothetical protein